MNDWSSLPKAENGKPPAADAPAAPAADAFFPGADAFALPAADAGAYEWATLEFVQFLSYPFPPKALGMFVEREVDAKMWMAMEPRQRHMFNIEWPRFASMESEMKIEPNKEYYNQLANIQMGVSLKEQVEADNTMSDGDLECKYDKDSLLLRQNEIWSSSWGQKEKMEITNRVLYKNFPQWEVYREPENALKNLKLLIAFVSSPYFQEMVYGIESERDRNTITQHLIGVAQSLSTFTPQQSEKGCEDNPESGKCLFDTFTSAQANALVTGQLLYSPEEVIINANVDYRTVGAAMEDLCKLIKAGTGVDPLPKHNTGTCCVCENGSISYSLSGVCSKCNGPAKVTKEASSECKDSTSSDISACLAKCQDILSSKDHVEAGVGEDDIVYTSPKEEFDQFRRFLKGGKGGAKGGGKTQGAGSNAAESERDAKKKADFERAAFDASGKGLNRAVEIVDMMKNFADYGNQGFDNLAKREFPYLDPGDEIKQYVDA